MRTLTGLNAVKTTGTAAWDEQVYAPVGYTGGAYASARAQAALAMFGLNTDPTTNASYASIDYAWYTDAANQLRIYESGIFQLTAGTWAANDLLEVIYDGANIQYKWNGAVIRTVAVAGGLTFYFDSSFWTVGELRDIRFGPNSAPISIAFTASAGVATTAAQRASAAAAEIASHTIVEITDPDGNWRDLSQAIQGTDWLNGGSIEETADGNSQRFNMTLQRDVRGFQILSNPEFAGGSLNGYGIYGDGGSGISLTAEVDADAPSGWRMKITHPAGGAPTPGIGGFYRGIGDGGNVSSVNVYRRGGKIIWKITALIPVGSLLQHGSNAYGDQGTFTWRTSQAGTGAWADYIAEQRIGRTGTFSTTGFFYLGSGTRPLNWYVRRITATDVESSLMTSLVPLRTDTAANRNAAGAYAPVLDLNRKWRVRTATLPPGQAPIATDYEEVGNGFYDSLVVNDSPAVIQIAGRDAGAVLLDGYIRTKRTYGSAGGVSLESALQLMIDDNAADNNYLPSTSGGLTLYVPVATGLIVNTWEQQPGNLMQALNAAAGKLGYIVRFRYDAADVLRLTLWRPNRGATIEDFTLGPTEYLNIPFNKLGPIDQVKNIAEVRFWDTASGTIHTIKSPNPETSASISKFGKRYIGFDVSSSGPINSDAKAQIYMDAVRSDLETPALEQQIESFGLWWVQLGDYVKTLANGTHYDTDQLGGVIAFTHTFGAGTWRTIINLKGKPAGRYGTWLSQGTTDLTGGATPSPINPPIIAVTRSFVTPPTTTQESVLVTGAAGTGGSGFQWRYRVIQENTVAPAWGAFSTVPALPVEVTVTRGLKWKRTIETQATDASGVIVQDAYDIASKMDALNDNGVIDNTINMAGGARPFGRGIDTAADVVITTVRAFIDPATATQVDASGRIVGVYRLGVMEPVNNLVKAGDALSTSGFFDTATRTLTGTWKSTGIFSVETRVTLTRSAVEKGYFWISTGANQGITGSVTDDVMFRLVQSGGRFLFSTDNGTSSIVSIGDYGLRTAKYFWMDQAYESGLVGLYDPAKYRMIYAMGDLYRMPAGGTTLAGAGPGGATFYGLFFAYDDNTGAGKNVSGGKNLSHGLGIVANGVAQAFIGAGMWTSGQSYASDFVLV